MKKISTLQIASVFIGYIAFAVLFQWISGNLLWTEGLIFNTSMVLMCFIVVIGLYIKNPSLLAERFRKTGTGDEKKWDVVIVILLKLMFFLWFIALPLDKRFDLSPEFPLWLKVLSGIGLLKSIIILIGTFFTNAYLSPLVRMQEKQKVITGGLYKLVRHPMYLGLFAMLISSAIMCNSIWGIVLSLLSLVILVIRIKGEESMLMEELDGYDEYKKQTKYRLFPFIW